MATLSEKSHLDIEQGTARRSSADLGGGGGSSDDEILGVSDGKRRGSSDSDESSFTVDLESGTVPEQHKPHFCKIKRNCRICHLSLDFSNPDSGIPLELGCSCKEDLAAAHKHCAEAWFKIRGNKTCEICNSTARNVVGVNEATNPENGNDPNAPAPATNAPVHSAETRRFWQGNRFLNFFLACMVFAFVISWLFHFNVPSYQEGKTPIVHKSVRLR